MAAALATSRVEVVALEALAVLVAAASAAEVPVAVGSSFWDNRQRITDNGQQATDNGQRAA